MSKFNTYTTQAVINLLNAAGTGASFKVEPNKIIWDTIPDTTPTDSEIIAEQTRLEQEWIATEYQRNRRREYPNFVQYLDGIVKGDQEQIQAYIDACQAVKAKYPKP